MSQEATRNGSQAEPRPSFLKTLHSIKIGGGSETDVKVPRRELAFMLRSLATLVENGISLRNSIATLEREKSLKKYAHMLATLRRRVDAGESFSAAMAEFPVIFNTLVVNQVRTGERSGSIPETLIRIADQVESGNELRRKIIKQLSYPAVVCVAGSAVVTFMLIFVIPQFEETYKKTRVPLPLATKGLIAVGNVAAQYGWIAPIVVIGSLWAFSRARRNRRFAAAMDRGVLRLPVLGQWARDIAVYQFIDVLSVMMESGFKLVDALAVSVDSIANSAVRHSVEDLRSAVTRGERLSRELERHGDMFPPIVSQLVIVGEKTGNLSKSTRYIRAHLRTEIERKAETMVAALEPILTIGMALAIGGILLAIYLPMFGMVDTIDQKGP